jgi:hypothetical protein
MSAELVVDKQATEVEQLEISLTQMKENMRRIDELVEEGVMRMFHMTSGRDPFDHIVPLDDQLQEHAQPNGFFQRWCSLL